MKWQVQLCLFGACRLRSTPRSEKLAGVGPKIELFELMCTFSFCLSLFLICTMPTSSLANGSRFSFDLSLLSLSTASSRRCCCCRLLLSPPQH